jgi:hypothetical protein
MSFSIFSSEDQQFLDKTKQEYKVLKQINPVYAKDYLQNVLQSDSAKIIREKNRTHWLENARRLIETFNEKKEWIATHEVTVEQLCNKKNNNQHTLLKYTPSAIDKQQKAMEAYRPDELLSDEKSLRAWCQHLIDTARVSYEKDCYGNVCITFPELNLSVRYDSLRAWTMKEWPYDADTNANTNHYTLVDTEFPNTWELPRVSVYKDTIDNLHIDRIQQIDHEYYQGYEWQKREDLELIFSALAQQLGVMYESSQMFAGQVEKAYMWLKWALGREWLNSDRNTKQHGDRYGKDNAGRAIDGRCAISFDKIIHTIHWTNAGDWSIPLLKRLW